MTQEVIIKKYLEQQREWVPSYELIKKDTDWGFLGSGADRAARSLAISGEINRARGSEIGKDKKFTYFKAKESMLQDSLF